MERLGSYWQGYPRSLILGKSFSDTGTLTDYANFKTGTLSAGCCLPGVPLKASTRNAAPAMAPLPGIAVLESWMRKCPPKGGLALCSLCVATWTNPDPSSAPSVGTALQHVRNKALTTRPLQQLLQTEHSSISRPHSLPCFQTTRTSSQITPLPSQQRKWKVNMRGL